MVAEGGSIRNQEATGPWVFVIHLFQTFITSSKRGRKVAKSIKFLSCFIPLDLQNDLLSLLLQPAHLEQTR